MDDDESENFADQVRECQRSIDTWRNRAGMAWQHSRLDLSEQALARMWEYQVKLAELTKSFPPHEPPPPEEYFRDIGGGGGGARPPLDPSRVPKRPIPENGSGALALPLPSREDDLS